MSKHEHVSAVWLAAMQDRHDPALADDYETPWEDCPAAKEAIAKVPERLREQVIIAVDARLMVQVR